MKRTLLSLDSLCVGHNADLLILNCILFPLILFREEPLFMTFSLPAVAFETSVLFAGTNRNVLLYLR